MVALAVAVNVAMVAPEFTVTEAGTVSRLLLEPSVTIDPPEGAVWFRVTVQVLAAPCPRLVGLQAMPETSAGASRLIVEVCELPPRVAVTVAVWLLDMLALAVAANVAVVAPELTVTDAGTVRRPLLLASVTIEPPAGAVWVRVVVHVEVPLPLRAAGVHVTEDTAGTAMPPPAAPIEGIAAPFASTPIGLMSPIEVLVAVEAKVT